jgi:hypothetical protein
VSHELVMSSGRQVGYDMVAAGLVVALAGVCGAVLLARRRPRPERNRSRALEGKLNNPQPASGEGAGPTITAARRLNRSAGVLAFSVLADSAIEHYRGSFFNPAMYTPLVVSAAALGVSGHGILDRSAGAHRLRDLSYSTALVTGLAGTTFHLYNVCKRPGEFRWENLFYAAPLGAPSALLLSGLLGFMSERVRDIKFGQKPLFLSIPMGRFTAALTAVGLLGTAAEAGLLHFRGAYHDPFMFIPVTLPPGAAVVMSEVALGSASRNRPFSRWWLRMTAAIGFAGVGFHAYGVHRNMGGWRNWRQNVLNGPPLPAPPSFAGLALAGLAALSLREELADA